MLRKLMKVGLAGALGVAALVLASGTESVRAQDKEKEVPTIKEIMKKGHAKTDGYIDKIKAAHENLAKVSQQAGSLLYAQQGAEGAASEGANPGAGAAGAAGATGAAGADDVVDAEIVEDDKK